MCSSQFPYEWMTKQFHTLGAADVSMISRYFPFTLFGVEASSLTSTEIRESSETIRDTCAEYGLRVFALPSHERLKEWISLIVQSTGNNWSYHPHLQEFLAPYFPIISEDGSTISIFCSLPDIVRNRRTNIKLGKFIRRLIDAPDHTVEDLVSTLRARLSNAFNLAVTSEEIKQVYINGPHSCMAGDEVMHDRRGTRYHPAEIYCYPYNREEIGCNDDNGVYVAYLGTLDKPQARAVVRHFSDGTKLYNTTYGYSLLERLLKKAGYTQDYEMLRKANLTAIGDEDNGFLCPYLDGWDGVDYSYSRQCLTVGDEYSCDTSGWAYPGSSTVCEHCGDRVDEDYATYIENADGYVCEHCLDRYYTFARVDRWGEEYIREEEAVTMEDTSNAFSLYYARDVCYQCEQCEHWFEDLDNLYEHNDCFYCDSCHEEIKEEENVETIELIEDRSPYCNAISGVYGSGEWFTSEYNKTDCVYVPHLGWVRHSTLLLERLGCTLCPECWQWAKLDSTDHGCTALDRTPAPDQIELILA